MTGHLRKRPFRLPVPHYLVAAPSSHPAHRTGDARLAHLALRYNAMPSPHGRLCGSFGRRRSSIFFMEELIGVVLIQTFHHFPAFIRSMFGPV
jgi:hypothetical protein